MRKEYYEKHKDEIKIKQKQYYEKHKKEILDYHKQYYEDNKNEINVKRKEYYQDNKDEVLEQSKKYYQDNNEIIKKSVKEYQEENKEVIKVKKKQYYQDNKERFKDRNKKYQEKNKSKIKIQRKEYYEDNKQEIGKIKKEYDKRRYKKDPKYRLYKNLRRRIQNSLKSQSVKKCNKSIKLLGCTIDFYKNYIEKQFDENMSWENQGSYWVIDHIVPISSFDLTQESQQLLAFNWFNTRPLERIKNIEKGDKFEVYTSEGIFLV
jgi:hypothetical protein